MRFLNVHHIYPEKYYTKSPSIRICDKCKDEIEKQLPTKKVAKEIYQRIYQTYLKRRW